MLKESSSWKYCYYYEKMVNFSGSVELSLHGSQVIIDNDAVNI